MNSKKNIIIGISSSISAFKILDLIKLLKKDGWEVYVVMTENAKKMISEKEFEKASGNKVNSVLFPKSYDYKKTLRTKYVKHIDLSKKADIFLISPATANVIGKIAYGIADDFLTTVALATKAPILICPSMNTSMWENQIVRENISKLKGMRFYVLFPHDGSLACGEKGIGRLPDIKIIKREIDSIIKKRQSLKGKKIVVTAGGTSEPIDRVRIITNRSSGKMGRAIAQVCFRKGADVIFLRAKNSVSSNYPLKEKVFETSDELKKLMKKYVSSSNVVFHVAAVSDFKPVKIYKGKIDSSNPIMLNLRPTDKICDEIKIWNPNIVHIGFKAVYKRSESELIKSGIAKLKEGKTDYIVVNDVGKDGIGFEVDDNEVYIISKKGFIGKISKKAKEKVASELLEKIIL